MDRDILFSVRVRLDSALNIFSLLAFLFFFSLLCVAGSFLLPWSAYAYYIILPLLALSLVHVLFCFTLFVRALYSFASRIPLMLIFTTHIVLAIIVIVLYLHNILGVF
jgi:hypothetical protein